MGTIYLNGRLMPIEQATVPVMDRGFLFGDGVYEVIPVYSRRPFRIDEHLRRLQASLDAIRLTNPHTPTEWADIVGQVITAAPEQDQSIYLQVTRGPDVKRNHAFPATTRPTVFLMSEPLPAPTTYQLANGVSAVSAADNRWHRCDIKSISLLANVLLRQSAMDAGCAETVLFRDGFLTEGAAANIFVVREGVLLAPPKGHLMLPGITYDVVLDLARANGLPCEVRDILEDEVRVADELWLTSSTKEVLAIVRLDERPVGNGRPGPVHARMLAWYLAFKAKVMRNGG